MIKITVIALGKIKDQWIINGIDEYAKRLSGYCNFDIIELPEGRLPNNPSTAEAIIVLDKEATAILNAIPQRALVVGLIIEGKELSSPQLAELIESSSQAYSNIVFIIGSSHGLSVSVKAICRIKLSFSKLTFPHQLMRLVLSEQIYRAFSILNNNSYHK